MNTFNKGLYAILYLSLMLGSLQSYAQESKNVTPQIQTDKTEKSIISTEKKGKLLFFLNPNGRPCQMQDKILQGSKADIEKSAKIVYFKTTNRDDLKNFYKYGVRGLPAMILASSDGKVIHRFPLGIQSKATILEKLKLTAKK